MCVHRTLPINTSRKRHAKRRTMGDSRTIEDQLRDLRRRADDDFLHPEALREPGRHQLDLPELGLRVSVTRSRYPNRPDGVDQYAVTLSRPNLDRRLGDDEVVTVLAAAFGDASEQAVERSAGASRVRMFRVPAQTGESASS
jgi:hypothetical protein